MSRPPSSRSASVGASSSSASSQSSSSSSEAQQTYPILDEQFLPRIVAIFYSIFHPVEGAKVVYQVPEEVISTTTKSQKEEKISPRREESPFSSSVQAAPKSINRQTPIFDFKTISDFIIPKAPLCGRLISYSIASSTGQTYKILSHPVILLDQIKYPRKSFIFNLAFVFDGRADTRAYEPIVRKCARELRDLETSNSFLSQSESRMYVVIEQLFEDLNSYCESFVALPEAPHSKFSKIASSSVNASRAEKMSRQGSKTDTPDASTVHSPDNGSAFKIPEGTANADKSWTSLSVAGDSLRKALEQVGQTSQAGTGEPTNLSKADSRPPVRRASTEQESAEGSITALSSSLQRTSIGDATALGRDLYGRKGSAGSIGRPGIGRSKTLAALAINETTVSAVATGFNASTSSVKSPTSPVSPSELSSTAMGRNKSVSSDTTLQVGVSAKEGVEQPEVGLQESILSLRAVEAPGDRRASESVGAVPPAAMLAPGKREPPHGLGRTVRDAINLKLFPTYPNPTEINDWDVPVTLLDLRKRVTGNWDLTMCRVLPFIDGINHVKRIAQLADADLELTRQCIEHLLYYRCIITTDIFQFTNMYTVRPSIAVLAEDEVIMTECAKYVTKSGKTLPSWPKLLTLYSSLRSAVTINDWMEGNDVDLMGIDVRRFVSFGVIKGFLRRVHRFPFLMPGSLSPTLEAQQHRPSQSDFRFNRDASNSRSRESVTAIKQAETPLSSTNRGLSPQMATFVDPSSFLRGRHGPRQLSENESLREGGTGTSVASGNSMNRRRMVAEASASQRKKVRATAIDAAHVALEATAAAREQDRQSSTQTTTPTTTTSTTGRVSIRTPLPRGGSSTTIQGAASSNNRGEREIEDGSSFSTIARGRRRGSTPIPPGLMEMLDGTHPDDEFCVRFGLSWNEIYGMLVSIGKQPQQQQQPSGGRAGGASSAGAPRATTPGRKGRGEDVTPAEDESVTLVGAAEGDESGVVANWSGFYSTTIGNQQSQPQQQYQQQQQQQQQQHQQQQRRSIGSSLPKFRQNASTGTGGQSGFSRYASTGGGENASTWGRLSGFQTSSGSMGPEEFLQADRESVARGDLGRVKIIVK